MQLPHSLLLQIREMSGEHVSEHFAAGVAIFKEQLDSLKLDNCSHITMAQITLLYRYRRSKSSRYLVFAGMLKIRWYRYLVQDPAHNYHNQTGCDFLFSLGRRLTLVLDDPLESSFLFSVFPFLFSASIQFVSATHSGTCRHNFMTNQDALGASFFSTDF